MKELTISEKLMHTTVRLECELHNGFSSTGTGFFFSFEIDKKPVPVIVTNKHVIQSSKRGGFVLTRQNDANLPLYGKNETIILDDFEDRWIPHPEQNVDLAIFPLGPLFNEAEKQNIRFFSQNLSEELIPNKEVIGQFAGIEEVTMIGYPNGIWDTKNNMPIVRRGITATHPKVDFEGEPFFFIDCACFPGSSGSPVFIYNQGGYGHPDGGFVLGNRLILLGVLFAGPQHIAEGKIQTIKLPLGQEQIAISGIPNNLGIVVKSRKILDFRTILEEKIRQG